MSLFEMEPICPTCKGSGKVWNAKIDAMVACKNVTYHSRAEEVVAVQEEAIKRADSKPSDEWKNHAAEMILKTAQRLPEFTSEDVWDTGLKPPDNGSTDGDALGPAMRRAKNAGIIEFTGRTSTQTNRPQRHNNPKRVWRSLVYKASSSG